MTALNKHTSQAGVKHATDVSLNFNPLFFVYKILMFTLYRFCSYATLKPNQRIQKISPALKSLHLLRERK